MPPFQDSRLRGNDDLFDQTGVRIGSIIATHLIILCVSFPEDRLFWRDRCDDLRSNI